MIKFIILRYFWRVIIAENEPNERIGNHWGNKYAWIEIPTIHSIFFFYIFILHTNRNDYYEQINFIFLTQSADKKVFQFGKRRGIFISIPETESIGEGKNSY